MAESMRTHVAALTPILRRFAEQNGPVHIGIGLAVAGASSLQQARVRLAELSRDDLVRMLEDGRRQIQTARRMLEGDGDFSASAFIRYLEDEVALAEELLDALARQPSLG